MSLGCVDVNDEAARRCGRLTHKAQQVLSLRLPRAPPKPLGRSSWLAVESFHGLTPLLFLNNNVFVSVADTRTTTTPANAVDVVLFG